MNRLGATAASREKWRAAISTMPQPATKIMTVYLRIAPLRRINADPDRTRLENDENSLNVPGRIKLHQLV